MRPTLLRRSLLPAAIAALGLAGVAHAQEHWLVGTWRGLMVGPSGNNQRTLRVARVAPDGTATATWSGQDAQARVVNNEVTITPADGNRFVLTRGSDGSLSGSMLTGRSGTRSTNLVLTRQ